MATEYDAWVRPTEDDLKFEWETEHDKMSVYLNTDYFNSEENFLKVFREHGKVMRLPREVDAKVGRRTHCDSVEEVEMMVSTYRSASRRKGVPTKLAEMMKNGEPLPMPIIIRFNGSLKVMSGNTRLDIAEILEVTPDPKVLFVDLDKVSFLD